jgi:hypothetical protein
MHFQFIGPASGEGVDTSHPENAGYSPVEIVRLLDQAAERGHTFDLIDTDALTPDARLNLYNRLAAEFAIHARKTKRKGERISRVYRGYDALRGGHVQGAVFGKEVPALAVYSVKGGEFLGVYPHDEPDGSIPTISGFLGSLLRLAPTPVQAS